MLTRDERAAARTLFNIVGHIPDPASLPGIDFSILDEVIAYIMKLSLAVPLAVPMTVEMKLPDWGKKIQFNGLSSAATLCLNNGVMQINSLQQFIDNESNFLGDSLRDKMNEIYIAEKDSHTGDDLFWAIVKTASPKAETSYQAAVIVIMAKYFESCDIFERPIRRMENKK
ncbi:MAG: hypothetical protein LBF74_01900 [Treponema sp.]|nr:hypothetical protein [Treponema sp.]